MMTNKHVDAEDHEEGRTHQETGLAPGPHSAESGFSQPRNESVAISQYTASDGHSVPRDVKSKVPSDLGSTMLDASSQSSSSLHDRSTHQESLRHGNRVPQRHIRGNGVPSKNGGREHMGGHNRPTEDRRTQRGDEVNPQSKSRLRAAAKKISTFLEPEAYEDHYGYADEQDGRVAVQITNMLKEIHRLGALNGVQDNTIADLRSKLQIVSANSQSIKESANKMALAMESKDLFVGRQDSDDVVITRFGLLVGQIKTWSVPFAAQEKIGTRIDLSGATMQEIRRVVPGGSELDRFLHTPKNVRLFVRGWVGLVMSEMLFRTLPSGQHHGSQGKDLWMDQEIALSFLQMENTFFHADRKAITLRDLHDWRALTAGLVSKLHATSKTAKGMEGHVSNCSHHIMTLIGPWVNLDTRKRLEEDLLGILLQAVEFSQILRCQRASWSVRHVVERTQDSALTTSDAAMFFNKTTMDDKHGDDSDDDDSMSRYQKLVEIVVSPGLFKRGNTDGERFEFESCVEPAEVRCYRQPARGKGKGMGMGMGMGMGD